MRVFINFLTALRPKARRQSPASRPLVLVIDRPGLGLVVVLLIALVLVAVGALADELLSLPHSPVVPHRPIDG
jgi:hypothetical protein